MIYHYVQIPHSWNIFKIQSPIIESNKIDIRQLRIVQLCDELKWHDNITYVRQQLNYSKLANIDFVWFYDWWLYFENISRVWYLFSSFYKNKCFWSIFLILLSSALWWAKVAWQYYLCSSAYLFIVDILSYTE
jgi:hypothetical protein